MKITGDMKIRDVLAIDEAKMISTLIWLAPQFERLQYPKLRRVMSGRVTVRQAAKIAHLPLTEALYVLNLAAGVSEDELDRELALKEWTDLDFEYLDTDPVQRPDQILGLRDDAERIFFVDLLPHAEEKRDPLPSIVRALAGLKSDDGVLLIRHPFDPIPLRELLARRGYESWAEERESGRWYIFFYKPRAAAGARAHPPIDAALYQKAFAAAA